MMSLLNSNIHPAMRHVADAIKEDSENNLAEAYWKYLHSMQFIIYNLLEDYKVKGKFQVEPQTKKFVKLGQQCMERISTIVNNSPCPDVSSIVSPVMSPVQSFPPTIAPMPVATVNQSDVTTPTSHQAVSTRSPLLGKSVPRNLRPLQEAQHKNEKLLEAYKQRLANVTSNRHATDLSLRLQRRLIENAAIAKSKQAALERKTAERLKRIECEATEKFSCGEDRDFYSSVLKYEEIAEWPLAWRKRVSSKPCDGRIIHLLVLQILRFPEHPITKELMQYQYNIYDKINPLISAHLENLQNIRVPYISQDVAHQSNAMESQISSDVRTPSSEDHKEDAFIIDSADVSSSSEKCEESHENNDDPSQVNIDTSNSFASSSSCGDDASNTASTLYPKVQAYGVTPARPKTLQRALSCTGTEELDDLFEDDPWQLVDKSGKASIEVHNEISVSDGQRKIQQLELQALQQHVHDILEDVHLYYDKILHLVMVAYEEWNNDSTKEKLSEELEESFYKPLWPYILALFRVINTKKEIKLARVMTEYIHAGPEVFGIKNEICLLESLNDSQLLPVGEELCRLTLCTSPSRKLQCLVNFSRMICQCVDELHTKKSESLGADDLLPIICYVVNHSRMPFMWSECASLEEFIPERMLYGEEGYCLTTVQTALGYLMTLDKN